MKLEVIEYKSNGHHSKNKHCKCGKSITNNVSRCRSCSAKERCKNPENNPNYIDGRFLKKHHCVDCGEEISYVTWRWGGKRCSKCARIHHVNKIGRKIRKDHQGYIYIYCPNHPHKTSDGRILEHRLVMEQKLKRFLEQDEIVHHLNGIRDDNRTENLILTIKGEHEHFTFIKQLQRRIVDLETENDKVKRSEM